MQVRPAADTDLPALLAMARTLNAENPDHRHLGFGFETERASRFFLEMIRRGDDGSARVSVVQDEAGACVGLIVAVVASQFFSEDRLAAVFIAHVEAAHRAGPALQLLVADVEAWATSQGAQEVEFDVAPAMASCFDALGQDFKRTHIVENHLG